MNHRHIQTFLTVSAAFFAMNAPLQAHAANQGVTNATARIAQCARANANPMAASKASRQS
jgi:hypothetical protein